MAASGQCLREGEEERRKTTSETNFSFAAALIEPPFVHACLDANMWAFCSSVSACGFGRQQ